MSTAYGVADRCHPDVPVIEATLDQSSSLVRRTIHQLPTTKHMQAHASPCKPMQAHASPAKYLPEPKPKCQRTGRQLGLHDSKTSTERRLECMNENISLSCPVLSCPVLSCPTDLPGHPLRSAYLASFTFRHSASGHNSSHEVNNHRDLSPSGKASTGFPIIPFARRENNQDSQPASVTTIG